MNNYLSKTNFFFNEWFEKILSDPFLTTAAISHLYFKTVWIKNQVKKDLAISDLKKTVLNMFNANRNEATTDKVVVDNSKDKAEDSSFFYGLMINIK